MASAGCFDAPTTRKRERASTRLTGRSLSVNECHSWEVASFVAGFPASGTNFVGLDPDRYSFRGLCRTAPSDDQIAFTPYDVPLLIE